jgi:imidazole glycerol-phosphate synthase subunit HisH
VRKPVVTVVDYGMGNLRSVQKALEACGARAVITSRPQDVLDAEKIVLPGVGAFTQAVDELERRRLIEPLRRRIEEGVPYLGICLGLQLLFSGSDEGRKRKGLGVVRGRVRRFGRKLKVPHMGWNTLVVARKNCPLLKGIRANDRFYFVHSYHGRPIDRSWVLAETDYGARFCSAVWKGNVFATQFHPEKSQKAGLRLLRNFVRLRPAA